ncbi:MAG TPA: hypothetical protein VIF60_14715 [Burkholderiaceae bacterium]|jgi:hypothetical protein
MANNTVENIERLHDTPEYIQAKFLLSERDLLQGRLREVNKTLRKLDTIAAGVTGLARKAPLVASKSPTFGRSNSPTQDVINCNAIGRNRSIL